MGAICAAVFSSKTVSSSILRMLASRTPFSGLLHLVNTVLMTKVAFGAISRLTQREQGKGTRTSSSSSSHISTASSFVSLNSSILSISVAPPQTFRQLLLHCWHSSSRRLTVRNQNRKTHVLVTANTRLGSSFHGNSVTASWREWVCVFTSSRKHGMDIGCTQAAHDCHANGMKLFQLLSNGGIFLIR